jgi:hypothetical protein
MRLWSGRGGVRAGWQRSTRFKTMSYCELVGMKSDQVISRLSLSAGGFYRHHLHGKTRRPRNGLTLIIWMLIQTARVDARMNARFECARNVFRAHIPRFDGRQCRLKRPCSIRWPASSGWCILLSHGRIKIYGFIGVDTRRCAQSECAWKEMVGTGKIDG